MWHSKKAEYCINPSEEVIQLGQLRVRYLVTGDNLVGQHCSVRTDCGRAGRD